LLQLRYILPAVYGRKTQIYTVGISLLFLVVLEISGFDGHFLLLVAIAITVVDLAVINSPSVEVGKIRI